MSLFGKLVKTFINVAELPVAVTKDILTLGGTVTEQDVPYTRQLVEKIKDEVEEEE